LPKFSLKYLHETNDSRSGTSTRESLALSLKDEDSKLFVYTSDTGFSDDLAPFAKDAAYC